MGFGVHLLRLCISPTLLLPPTETIKVCWTHACCPSAGCSSIKSVSLWKWVAVPHSEVGGWRQIENPLRSAFILSAIKPETPLHPALNVSHLTFRLSQSAPWSSCLFSPASLLGWDKIRVCARKYQGIKSPHQTSGFSHDKLWNRVWLLSYCLTAPDGVDVMVGLCSWIIRLP